MIVLCPSGTTVTNTIIMSISIMKSIDRSMNHHYGCNTFSSISLENIKFGLHKRDNKEWDNVCDVNQEVKQNHHDWVWFDKCLTLSFSLLLLSIFVLIFICFVLIHVLFVGQQLRLYNEPQVSPEALRSVQHSKIINFLSALLSKPGLFLLLAFKCSD